MTILAILLTDLLTGVLLGLAVGVLVVLHLNFVNSHTVEVEESDDAKTGHIVRLQLAEQVSFLSRGALLRELSNIPDGLHVIIDLSRTVSVDHDVLEILRDFEDSAQRRDLVVETTPRENRVTEVQKAA